MLSKRDEQVRRLAAALPHVSDALLAWIDEVVRELSKGRTFVRNPASNLVNNQFLDDLGDTLRLHHVFSNEPFSKDKFEYAMEWIANRCGHKANLARKGNPGHDITIDGVSFSLKTQANKGIKLDEILISKFMELGKGKWGADPSDLDGLRDQFLEHMKSYERILTLRYLEHDGPRRRYELVEIPKALLQRAKTGDFEMKTASKQMPRPGYCRVHDKDGSLLFELYFDGGSERKLQVHHLSKAACVVHADWVFDCRQNSLV